MFKVPEWEDLGGNAATCHFFGSFLNSAKPQPNEYSRCC